MKINNHILEKEGSDPYNVDSSLAEGYVKNKMDRDSGEFASGRPDTIIVHYTGGIKKEGAINALYHSNMQVSAHFVLDVDGTVYQLMPLNKIGWHAGKSAFGDRSGFNKYSLGIEIVNPGYLNKADDGEFYTYFNNKVKDKSKAVLARHPNETRERYWHAYEEAQIISTFHLCEELAKMFGIRFIFGHDEISPGRKQDPGPLFPTEQLRDAILNPRKNDDIREENETAKYGVVNASSLNIRELGSANARKVAAPLKKGAKVQILGEDNGWLHVKAEIEGWVSKDYVRQ